MRGLNDALADSVELWLRDRGWNTASWFQHAMSIRGPWQHPHHDGRPVVWWDLTQPMEVFGAMAPVVGLPAHHLRADFLRWFRSRLA